MNFQVERVPLPTWGEQWDSMLEARSEDGTELAKAMKSDDGWHTTHHDPQGGIHVIFVEDEEAAREMLLAVAAAVAQ